MLTNSVTLKEAVGAAKALTASKYRAKLVAADTWGSTAYYPAEVLERDGARVFHKGLHMFRDHMTEDETWQRPEGSVDRLVGVLESDAEFEADGEDGPGLYADVSFYPSYVERIAEIKKDVGLSIRAQGLTEDGEMDGRYGPILVGFLVAHSVDVVTRAGAGGKLTSILENDRGLAGEPIETKEKSVTDLTKEDFEAGINPLVEAINGLPAAITTALAANATPGVPAEGKVENGAESSTETSTEAVEIDHAAIVESLSSNGLPAVAAKAIVADLKAGKTLEDAVKAQVELKEAFTKSAPEFGTVIKESAGAGKQSDEPTGLAFALREVPGTKK